MNLIYKLNLLFMVININDFKALKPACVKALSRIFKLCDLEGDGILTDEEIMEFQVRIFW